MGFLKRKEKKEQRLYVASQWKLMYWRFFRHKLAIGGLVVLAMFYFIAIFVEFVAPYDPHKYDKNSILVPPQRVHFFDEEGGFHLPPFTYSLEQNMDPETYEMNYVEDRTRRYPVQFLAHGDPYKLWGLFKTDIHLFGIKGGKVFLLGTGPMGRDLFSRIIYGTRISLSIGLVGVAVSFLFGVIMGGISGYYGGRVDVVIQRVIESIRSIPTLPLWMALSVALPPHWTITETYFAITLIFSVVGWTEIARVVRGKFMSIRKEDFITAAKLDGASEMRIIRKYLFPSFLSHIIAAMTLAVPTMILGETALSFLGLGMQAPAISWGVLLKEAQHIRVLAEAPWILISAVPVVISILAVNFVGDGLRDAADPYARV